MAKLRCWIARLLRGASRMHGILGMQLSVSACGAVATEAVAVGWVVHS